VFDLRTTGLLRGHEDAWNGTGLNPRACSTFQVRRGDFLYAELLASVTFALVAYYDFKDRMVSDWVWVFAIAGGVAMLVERPDLLVLSLEKVGVLGALGAASILLGFFGQADGLTIVALAVGTSYWSPLPQLFAGAAVAIVHIFFTVLRNGSFKFEKLMPVEEAIKQNVWIPLEVTCEGKTVELDSSPEKAWDQLKEYLGRNAVAKTSYGVPLAGYFAIGYIVAVGALLLGLP
jgi:hypothetical protein